MSNTSKTPGELGYYLPAEWSQHEATWLSFPHNLLTWPSERMARIHQTFFAWIRWLSRGEEVRINVQDEATVLRIRQAMEEQAVDLNQVRCFIHPSNDAWCRDHGPAFLVNPEASEKKIIVDWTFNAWGSKYEPFDDDDRIPGRIAELLALPYYRPGIVMEGGSVDFNGQGTVLTTRSCLLNTNRNPHLNQTQIEEYLHNFYGVSQVLWLDEGIAGDDTDGHIDDITRFVNEDTVVTVVEHNAEDPNYAPLQKNLKALKEMRLLNGKQLNIIELPMPTPLYLEGERMPASYANFYIANHVVVVPIFECAEDEQALKLLEDCFPGREVVGLSAVDLIWGLGSFHCLSQQEPAI
ncbi:MAG: agmatine deiminase family protein [Bacteroidia bacterium]|nr:agmatine deiminase family protein [Bacteroidia bacterium]